MFHTVFNVDKILLQNFLQLARVLRPHLQSLMNLICQFTVFLKQPHRYKALSLRLFNHRPDLDGRILAVPQELPREIEITVVHRL